MRRSPVADTPPDIPAPSVGESPAWAEAGLAQAEKRAWSELDDVQTKNDVRWARTYGFILVAATITVTGVALGIFVIWAWHYVARDSWTWIDAPRLEHLQSVVFSGGMGAIVSGIIQRQLARGTRK